MRAALYARVGSEEQVEGYSIDAQRRAFKALVEGRGWTIYQEYIEDGKSAGTDNINRRPAFKQMVTDALAKKFDVLVVHTLDRFSRNLRVTLEYFDKLSKAEVSFLSINEQMDFSTPWGKLALPLLGGNVNIRMDPNAIHQARVAAVTQKKFLGQWLEEAIAEKIEREQKLSKEAQ